MLQNTKQRQAWKKNCSAWGEKSGPRFRSGPPGRKKLLELPTPQENSFFLSNGISIRNMSSPVASVAPIIFSAWRPRSKPRTRFSSPGWAGFFGGWKRKRKHIVKGSFNYYVKPNLIIDKISSICSLKNNLLTRGRKIGSVVWIGVSRQKKILKLPTQQKNLIF